MDEERTMSRAAVPPSESAAAAAASPSPLPSPPSRPSKSSHQPSGAASSSHAEQQSEVPGDAQLVISDEKLAQITEVMRCMACALRVCAAAAAKPDGFLCRFLQR